MPEVTYLGGPCSGEQANLSASDIADGYTVCKAQSYRVFQTGPDTIYAVLPDTATENELEGVPDSQALGPNVLTHSTALGGWNNLMHAVSVGAPAGLRRADLARRTLRGI